MEKKTAPAGERAPTPATASNQKAGKDRSTELRVNLNQIALVQTRLHRCKRNLGSSFSCYQALTQWALTSLTSAVSWGDHSWKLPRTAWTFRAFQHGAGSTTCLVPAGPWLGMIQSLLRLQLYSKVAWTPQSTGITGLDTSSPQGSQACTSLACSDHGSPASQLCPNSLWMLNNLRGERQLLALLG